jgi:uncharacterized protein YciI
MIRTLFAILLAAVTLLPQPAPPRQFLLRIEPVRPDFTLQTMNEQERQLAVGHMSYLKGLFDSGTLTLAGQAFDPKGFFGIIIVNAPDTEAARDLMEGDPGVKGKMFRGEVIPFRTVLERGAR